MSFVKQTKNARNGSKIRVLISVIIGSIFALIFGLASSNTLEMATSQAMPSKTKQHQIVISGFEFVPKELTVSQGDRITWINKDIVPHNIAIDSDQDALSPDLASGEKFSFIVEDSLSYICGLHPSMQGKLIVK
jgi:plastocyanin